MQLARLLGLSPPFDAAHKLVTSPFFSPSLLASIRVGLASYSLFTLLFILIWDSVRTQDGPSYFSYFTNLSYIGLCAYFCASSAQTLVYSRREYRAYPLQNWPRALQFLHLLLQSTITTFPILVTIVFWALLSSPFTFSTPYSAWSNISRHALNVAFALFEILLTNAPPAPWLLLPCTIVILAGYLGVAYITHETQGFYTYAFLDPHEQGGLLAAYIVGVAVGQCVVFSLVRGLVVLRERYAVQRGLVGGGGSVRSRTPEGIEDWEEIDRPKTPPSSV